jgi:hypothetical protein
VNEESYSLIQPGELVSRAECFRHIRELGCETNQLREGTQEKRISETILTKSDGLVRRD